MFRTCTLSAVRTVRAFATAKNKPFLSNAIAKAAIGKDMGVAASFVSAFAGVVHGKHVQVTDVSALPETAGVTRARVMKHDISLRYSFGGSESAVMEVVPQHYNRALVGDSAAAFLPARALAHASGHYLAAINEGAKAVKKERAAEEAERLTAEDDDAKPRPKAKYDSALHTAYLRVEPVHQLMLSDFCYAHDTVAKKWRALKLASALAGGRYGWASPLFSTFRLTTDAGSAQPGPNTFASSLHDRLSITIVHLPMVPLNLEDMDAWSKTVTLPQHKEALESAELRQWLHFLARTKIEGGKVKLPPELEAHPIFRKSAEMAEALLSNQRFGFSEKELAEAVAEGVAEERAAAARERAAERAAAAEAQAAAAKERAAERAAAAEVQAAAAERVAALMSELERLKAGSVAS